MATSAEEETPLLSAEEQAQIALANDHTPYCSRVCNPFHWSHRFLFLFLICFLSFGNYFVYDNPAALQNQFQDDMNLSTSQYMLMYSIYSWPNVILCFVGGYLMDKVFGIRLGAIIFASFVLAGQIVVAIGATANSYPIVLIGRFIFGLGGENLAVAQNTYAVSWFKGKELNMVFGLQLSFSRVGSTLNNLVMSRYYDFVGHGDTGHKVLGTALWLGAFICAASLLTAIIAAYLDKRSSRITKKKEASVGEEINLKDFLKFPFSFWLMSIICVSYYVAIFPFIGLAPTFFQDKYGFSQEASETVNSLVYIISAVASPFFGAIVDVFGRNVLFVNIAVTSTLGAHCLLAYTFVNPYIGMVLMGFAYSLLAASLWPMVSLIIPEHQLGTAYGFMQAIQNLGLAVISLVAGIIVDDKGHLWLEVFFCAWLCLALMSSLLLVAVDKANGGVLNASGKRRKAEAAAIAEEQKSK